MKLSAALLLAPMLLASISNAAPSNPLQIPVRDISGKEIKLADLGAKAILVVNVASECGYTAQYEGLEAIYKSLKAKGLAVVGAPCNDFGAQEPGTDSDIKRFCTTRYQVTFPMLGKLSISGENAHPLFKVLTSSDAGHPGPVRWNFNKFLLSGDGRLVARFDSSVEPDSGELRTAINQLLSP